MMIEFTKAGAHQLTLPSLEKLREQDDERLRGYEAYLKAVLFLEMAQGRRVFPATLEEVADAPDWVKPVLEAAFQMDPPLKTPG